MNYIESTLPAPLLSWSLQLPQLVEKNSAVAFDALLRLINSEQLPE